MKKKFAVAMAITAGLCFAGGVKPAFAGHWEVVENPYLYHYDPSDPDYPNYVAQHALRAQGTTSITCPENYSGPSSLYTNWQDDDPYLTLSGFQGAGVTLISPKRGTSGSVTASGKLRIRFKWVRNQINRKSSFRAFKKIVGNG